MLTSNHDRFPVAPGRIIGLSSAFQGAPARRIHPCPRYLKFLLARLTLQHCSLTPSCKFAFPGTIAGSVGRAARSRKGGSTVFAYKLNSLIGTLARYGAMANGAAPKPPRMNIEPSRTVDTTDRFTLQLLGRNGMAFLATPNGAESTAVKSAGGLDLKVGTAMNTRLDGRSRHESPAPRAPTAPGNRLPTAALLRSHPHPRSGLPPVAA